MQVGISGAFFEFPTVWDIVRDIRELTQKRMSGVSPELRDATIITVTELAENLAKYANGEHGVSPVLELNMDDNEVVVHSENGVDSDVQAEEVLKIIKDIVNHPDPTELYADAIEKSLMNPSEGNRQGFYRIAAVGGFHLQATFENKRLGIIAKREI